MYVRFGGIGNRKTWSKATCAMATHLNGYSNNLSETWESRPFKSPKQLHQKGVKLDSHDNKMHGVVVSGCGE